MEKTLEEMLCEKYEFRNIHCEEAEQAAEMERICFLPKEACSREMMHERVERIPEMFLVAVDRHTGKIAGFISGLATMESSFRDEFFSDATLHNPEGRNIMLLGLEILPEHRGQGLARELMARYLLEQRDKGKHVVLLTCSPSKVNMYQKMGFRDDGIAASSWGESRWHEMSILL